MMKYKFLTTKNKKKKHMGIPYSLSSKPQRYGPGMNRAVISLKKEVSASVAGRFSLQSLLQDNPEFSNKKGFFKFFKIEEIRATFLPANVVGAFDNIAVMFSWWLTSYTLDSLYKDDSTKFVSVYRTKPKTIRFLPPRTVLDVQSIGTTAPVKFFDFSQFLSTDMTVNFPGWLYVYNPSTTSLFFQLEAVVLFRGNDFNVNPSLNKIKEENPFVDKFYKKEELMQDVDRPPDPGNIIIEDENEHSQEEEEAEQTNLKEFKILKIKELQKQIEEIGKEIEKEQEGKEEDKKEEMKEGKKEKIKEEIEDNKRDLVSRRNKPK